MTHFTRNTAIVLAGVLSLTAGVLFAQVPGLTRVIVGKGDVSVPGREALISRLEAMPGFKAGRHTHPGDEMTYVMEGEITLIIDGEPPRQVKAGEAFVVPAGVVHDAHNNTSGLIKLVAVHVVEKGKPLVTLTANPS